MPFLKEGSVPFTEYIYINGIGLGKWLQEYNINLSSLQSDNSGRKTEDGVLIVEDKRVDVGNTEITLYKMSRTDYIKIMEVLHQRNVTVKFFAGIWYEQLMNVGSDIKSYTKADGNDRWNVTFSLSAI